MQSNFLKFRFSLRWFLLVPPVLVASLSLWLSPALKKAKKIDTNNALTNSAIAIIEANGGRIRFGTAIDSILPGWSKTLKYILTVDFAPARFPLDPRSQQRVSFPRNAEVLEALKQIPSQYSLKVDYTDFCDADLVA